MTVPASQTAAGVRPEDAELSYFDHVRPELAELVPGDARRILDVGCGRGALGAHLKARLGAEVMGIEFFAAAADVAATRLDRVFRLDLDALDALPVPEGHFDAIIFGDVLEHLRDPHGLLRTMRRYLSPQGRIVCSIPNLKHWTVVFPLLVNDRFEYADAGLLDRTHIHFFMLDEISRM